MAALSLASMAGAAQVADELFVSSAAMVEARSTTRKGTKKRIATREMSPKHPIDAMMPVAILALFPEFSSELIPPPPLLAQTAIWLFGIFKMTVFYRRPSHCSI